MILFEQPYLTLSYNEELRCLTQHWKGYAKSEQFRKGIELSIAYFKEKNINKIISNTKDFAVLSNEDTNWVANYATPILVEHGLQYMIFILPTSIFAQLSVSNFTAKTEGKVTTHYFDDVSKAEEWLRTLE